MAKFSLWFSQQQHIYKVQALQWGIYAVATVCKNASNEMLRISN